MNKLILTLIVLFLGFTAKSQYNKGVILEPLLKTDTTTMGQKIQYPDFQHSEVSIIKVTIQPGKSTGWHKHDFPVFAYVVKGTLTIEFEDGKSLHFSESASFAEVINTYHNGINSGKDDVVLIAFFMGGKGMSLSIPKETKASTINH